MESYPDSVSIDDGSVEPGDTYGSPLQHTKYSPVGMPSSSILSSDPSILSPLHTRSGKTKSGKAKMIAQSPYDDGAV